MTNEQRLKITDNLYKLRLKILQDKGKAYANNEDVNSNFKVVAELLGLTPFQVWAVYFLKHIICITNSIKDNPESPVDLTEGLKGRILDAQNYLDILQSLLEEKEE
ncbi:MAG: hypothetical protein AB1695_12630 [Stygiobacter sp.]